jgi:hypothetical protein
MADDNSGVYLEGVFVWAALSQESIIERAANHRCDQNSISLKLSLALDEGATKLLPQTRSVLFFFGEIVDLWDISVRT